MLMDEDFQRLWSLLAELSGQLTANREQCEALKRQAEELKKQAIHTGTGYALRRFNVDLSQEQFESELERMNAQLVVENQTLQHENRQLSVLLKDYETTLEQVMSKFRSHAHSTQTHELDLVRYYEQAILSALEQSSLADPSRPSDGSLLADPSVLSSLQHLSSLVHRALRSLQGEEDPSGPSSSSSSSDGDAAEPGAPNPFLTRSNSVIPAPASSSAPPPPSSDPEPSSSTSPPTLSPPDAPAALPSYMPRLRDVASGGYVGPRGSALSDPALQNAIELEQLRLENSQLRELLGIAKELGGGAEGSIAAAIQSAAIPGTVSVSTTPGSLADGPSWLSQPTENEAAEEKRMREQQIARTGAGVVVPEELIKGAEIDAMEGKSSEGVLSESQV